MITITFRFAVADRGSHKMIQLLLQSLVILKIIMRVITGIFPIFYLQQYFIAIVQF